MAGSNSDRDWLSWLRHYLPYWSVILLLGFPWLASMMDAPDAVAGSSSTGAPAQVVTSQQFVSATPLAQTSGQRALSGTKELNIAADLSFALITFWLWAFTTSSYSGCSIRSAGEEKYDKKNGDRLRRAEFTALAFFALVTSLVYFASVIPQCRGVIVESCAAVAAMFPAFVLKSPP